MALSKSMMTSLVVYGFSSMLVVILIISTESEAAPAPIFGDKWNFFGINHNHESFGQSRYDKNCFFSPVNCVLYKGPVDSLGRRTAVFLRRADPNRDSEMSLPAEER